MPSKLIALLNKIDPEYTYDAISGHVNNAVNAFNLKSNIVTDKSDFQKTCASFYCLVENTVLGLNPPRKLHFGMDWGRFHKHLVVIYGENGHYAAFDIARTGKENGLYAILKAVADRMIEEYSRSIIGSKICDFWESLTIAEKHSAIKEYVETFGHLLPEEIIENGAPRIISNFHKVLAEHPRIIKRERNIGRIF